MVFNSKRPLFLVGCVYLAGTAAVLFLPRTVCYIAMFVFLFTGFALYGAGDKKPEQGLTEGYHWRPAVFLALVTLSVSIAVGSLYQIKIIRPLEELDGKLVPVSGVVEEAEIHGRGTKYVVSGQAGGSPTKMTLYTFDEIQAEMGEQVSCKAQVFLSDRLQEKGQGIHLRAFAKTPVQAAEGTGPLLFRLRGALLEKTAGLYHAPIRGMVQGMLFGYKKGLEPEIRELMNRSGAAHILAVSGLHVSILFLFMVKLLTLLGMHRRFAYAGAIPILFLFVALAGFSPSAVRAGLMAALHGAAEFLRRDADPLTSLGFSGMCMLVLNPYYLLSAGFLLSYFATLGILLFAAPIERIILEHPTMRRWVPPEAKLRRGAIGIFAMSLAVYPFSIPILLLFFQSVPIYSPVTSMLILWAVGPVLLVGFLSVLAAFIPGMLFLAKGLAFLTQALCYWILLAAKFISSFPRAEWESREWVMLVWSLIGAMFFLRCRLHCRKGERIPEQRERFICGLLCCAFLFLCAELSSRLMKLDMLEITATENALVLNSSQGSAVVGEIQSEYEAAQICGILRCMGRERPDVLIGTSNNLDNSAGMPDFLSESGVGLCILPEDGIYLEHIKAVLPKDGEGVPLGLKKAEPMKIILSDQLILELAERVLPSGKTRLDLLIYAGEKTVCKTSRSYGIIDQYGEGFDLLWDGENRCILFQQEGRAAVFPNPAGEQTVRFRLSDSG